jgi:hypothetical protein
LGIFSFDALKVPCCGRELKTHLVMVLLHQRGRVGRFVATYGGSGYEIIKRWSQKS